MILVCPSEWAREGHSFSGVNISSGIKLLSVFKLICLEVSIVSG